MKEAIAATPAPAPGADGLAPGGTEVSEEVLAEVLAGVLQRDGVPVDAHFFDDLGADSLVMARFCARLRKRGDMPSVSIKDVYANPTVRDLAASLGEARPAAVETSRREPEPAPAPPPAASAREYVLCGALQAAAFLVYCYLGALAAARAYDWVSAGSGVLGLYLRAVTASVAGLAVVCAFPILVKWTLVGRWKPQPIRLWSLGYVRFWIVRSLIRANPAALLFVGSPLYVLYLRALGATVGRGAVILSRRVPVCTDLLTIGEGTVIRRETLFQGYRAEAGRIEIGRVTLGRDVLVGERAVLDIDTSMGDGAQLGHASALLSGQHVPAGERWHGSPAQRTDTNYLRVAPAAYGAVRRVRFCVTTLLSVCLIYLPIIEGGLDLIVPGAPSPSALLRETLIVSLVVFSGAVLVGLFVVTTLPRMLHRFLEPGVVYPLYGFHDRVHRVIARLTTIRLFTYMLGDSSWVVPYLRGLGYDLSRVEQTGANFGNEVRQANPFLSFVGTGTMVADGLFLLNDEVSSTSFSLARAAIGPRNFIGNDVVYPAGGRTGENCLLATKAMIPLDGEIRSGIGLLGSPPFEIPRSVERDSRFDHLHTGEAFQRGLAAKNRYNARTIGIFLLARWCGFFLVLLIDTTAFALEGVLHHAVMAALLALSLIASALFTALVDRCVTRFRDLQPTYCSIYEPVAWLYERVWKVPPTDYLRILDGTPLKTFVWRLMGVRMGRRVFDDGVLIPDRTLTTIGDDAILNYRSKVQCHSQEDGTLKTDRSTVGAGCTLGVGALVHYGVTMGDGSVLAADSFLMKGEEIPPGARWAGNPAREM